MKSKKIFCVFLVCVIVSTLIACTSGGSSGTANGSADTESGAVPDSAKADGKTSDVLYWHWSEPFGLETAAAFEERFPEYKMTFEPVLQNEMLNRFKTTLASGGRVPDIMNVEWIRSGVVLSSEYDGLVEDLRQAPYSVDTSRILDWVVETSTAHNGELRGLEIGPAPTTLIFTKDTAKTYFGTDSPDELYKQLNTWDAVLDAGRKIKAESGGQAFLALDLLEFGWPILMQNETPTVVDGKINLRNAWREGFTFMHTLVQEGLVDKIVDPAAIVDAMANTPEKYLLWKCAMWQPRWTFYINAPEQVGTFATLPTLPGGKMSVGGGVLMTIPAKAENKEGGWAYINWLRNTKEGSAFMRDNYFDVASLKECYEDENFHQAPPDMLAYFDGFDPIKQFAGLIGETTANYKTQYDITIWENAFNLSLEALRNGASVDDALTAAVDELVRVHPELSE